MIVSKCCSLDEITSRAPVQVVQLGKKQNSVTLHKGICGQPGAGHGPDWNPKMPLLLLPPGYNIIDSGNAPRIMSELLMVRVNPNYSLKLNA